MSKQSIWFIINPYSGTKKNIQNLVQLIDNQLDKSKYIHQILLTEHAGHASEIAKKGLIEKINIIVAVGGDGTVNEIAKILVNSDTVLGIIPRGSGNGLARELGISTNEKKAIQQLNTPIVKQIDAGFINEIPFFCTAGFGFDAHCSDIFSKESHKRGLINYIKVGLKEFWHFKPIRCIFAGNDYEIFSMTFANARQFGNNAYIAPQAKIDDGFLDCMIINPMSVFSAPLLISQLFSQNLHFSNHSESYRGTKFYVQAEENFLIHYDGEPLKLKTNKLEIKITEKALKVIV